MAQRRMFSPQIVESDEFLTMPISSQALYFHLGMNADDDGFIQPKIIMRSVGSSDDDLKVLIAKRFLLPFESGVVVIKHWLIHNLIQKDRYHPTRFQEEKSKLLLKDNRSYTDNPDSVNKMLPEVRLGKDKQGEGTDTSEQEPHRESEEHPEPEKKSNLDDFYIFWESYPRKANIEGAKKEWRLMKIEERVSALEDIPKRSAGRDWKEQDGKFIPLPQNYLRDKRWHDEIRTQRSNVVVIRPVKK